MELKKAVEESDIPLQIQKELQCLIDEKFKQEENSSDVWGFYNENIR